MIRARRSRSPSLDEETRNHLRYFFPLKIKTLARSSESMAKQVGAGLTRDNSTHRRRVGCEFRVMTDPCAVQQRRRLGWAVVDPDQRRAARKRDQRVVWVSDITSRFSRLWASVETSSTVSRCRTSRVPCPVFSLPSLASWTHWPRWINIVRDNLDDFGKQDPEQGTGSFNGAVMGLDNVRG